jgi:hypothetical protein
MSRLLSISVVLMVCQFQAAQATAILGFTGFEEITSGSTFGVAGSWVPGGGDTELGWGVTSGSTDDLSDIEVASTYGNPGNGLLIEDVNSPFMITFDTVALAADPVLKFSIDILIESTSWSAIDFFLVDLTLSGGLPDSTVTVIDTRPTDFDDPGTFPENAWVTYAVQVDSSGHANATAALTFQGGANNDTIRVDNVAFTAIPEPTTFALGLMALLVLGSHVRRRRRR